MKKRQAAVDEAYEKQWDGGRGAHHPDYDPEAVGDNVVKGNRATEELYLAIVKNDVRKVYEKIDEGADVNFVYGQAYQSRGAQMKAPQWIVRSQLVIRSTISDVVSKASATVLVYCAHVRITPPHVEISIPAEQTNVIKRRLCLVVIQL